jgi:small subunit ribosomal protein S17
MKERGRLRIRVGEVTSNKPDKTASVRVDRLVKHATYGRTVRRSMTLHVHDPENQLQMGDMVRVAETRPLSKTKRWRLLEIVRRGGEKAALPGLEEGR